MTRAAEASIDLQALQYNLQQVRHHAKSAHVMAVIKANGYGHGMLRVAREPHVKSATGADCSGA